MNFYNKEGQPITLEDFRRLFADTAYKRIGLTEFSAHIVSTVWLGANHNFDTNSPPLIFETMVFKREKNKKDLEVIHCSRSPTQKEAMEQHEKAVAFIRALENTRNT